MRARLRTLLVVLAFGAVGPLAGCEKPPCEPPYSCPLGPDGGGTVIVDCMPPADGAPECTGQCHAWLTEHCSELRFVY